MKERIAKWDNVKFILILLVVLGHFVDYYEAESAPLKAVFLFIYSFHIPAFMFVSGLMSKGTVNSKPFKTGRVMSLFALYLLCNGLMLVCKLIAQKPYSVHLLGQDHYSWFVFVLPVYYLLTHALRKLPAWFMLTFWILAGCLAGYDSSVGDTWYLSRILVFYPFFLAGYYCNGTALLKVLDRLWVRFLSAALLLAGFVVMYIKIDKLYALRPLFTGRNSFEKAGEFFEVWGGGIRLLYYIGATVMIAAVIAVVPTRKTFFTKLGSRTLQVYVLHRPILYLMQTYGFGKMLHGAFPAYWWIPFFGTAVALTFVLSIQWIEIPFRYMMNPPGEREV